jgi:hypothetical protein
MFHQGRGGKAALYLKNASQAYYTICGNEF